MYTKFLDDLFSNFLIVRSESKDSLPPIAVDVEEENYTVSIDLPGVCPDDIEIETKGSVLTIKGVRRSGKGNKKRTFERLFSIPSEADPENISATSKYGVLQVTIPKVKKASVKKIKVVS